MPVPPAGPPCCLRSGVSRAPAASRAATSPAASRLGLEGVRRHVVEPDRHGGLAELARGRHRLPVVVDLDAPRHLPHRDRGARQHPARPARARRAAAGRAASGSKPSNGLASAAAKMRAGLEVAPHALEHRRSGRRIRRAAGPPASGRWRARSAAPGRMSGHPPPRSRSSASCSRARPRSACSSSGSLSRPVTACPRATRSSATRPVPQPMSSSGPPASPASSRQSGRSAS